METLQSNTFYYI